MKFSSCRGGDFCTQDGTHCRGCGRSHEEIGRTKALVGALTEFALEMGYENYEEFTRFVGDKAAKKIRSSQENGGAIPLNIGMPIR